MNSSNRITITTFVHQVLRDKVSRGNIVVDATMGNGKDTYFLYNLIGEEGLLYAFDIQETSIINTKKLFKDASIQLAPNIKLIHAGHENLDKYVFEPIDCCVFNLGYLPGGSHSIVTRPDTTLTALEAALKLLRSGGIVTISIYYGHEGGKEEKDRLLAYLKELPFESYNVMQWNTINNKNNPPIVIVIEKK